MSASKLEEEKKDGSDSEPEGPVENAWAMKIPEFKKGDMKYPLTEESSFSVMFPKYREKYLKECWPLLEKKLQEYGITAELDLLEGLMVVKTTRKTWDPFVILKARDIIVLLGRSAPLEQAIRVLQDDITYELVKIKGLVRNKERFVKRRQRLVGSNGTTLKALELLTNCYVLIQGGTVAAIGPHKGVVQVTRVVKDTMKNIHPVNLLKVLMIKRKLAQDESLKDADWSRFIPKYKSKNVQRKKPKKIKEKKPYTPFPPEQLPRKIDIEMLKGNMSGNYKKKENKDWNSKEKKIEVQQNQLKKRAHSFIAPEESTSYTEKKHTSEVDTEKLKKKLKANKQ